jgi:AcrR family transcriptional regulator
MTTQKEEIEFLRRLEHFLDSQEERLDDDDLQNLQQFLESYAEPLTQDWTRVTAAVKASSLPGASEVLASLESRLGRTPEAVAVRLRDHLESTRPLPGRPHVVFLIGAGASAAAPTNIPVVQDLLPILWGKAAEIGHRPLLRMREECERLSLTGVTHEP